MATLFECCVSVTAAKLIADVFSGRAARSEQALNRSRTSAANTEQTPNNNSLARARAILSRRLRDGVFL